MHCTIVRSRRVSGMAAVVSSVISFLTLVGVALGAPSVPDHHRTRRHALQMCELMAVHTNRGCMDYNNYGCFCGLGNAASHHVDAVDGCCRVHDRCYGEVSCFWMYPQFVGYNFQCNDGYCRCTDSPVFAACARTTCECDLAFSRCLSRAPYNSEFKDYDRQECNRPQHMRRRRRKSKKSKKRFWWFG